MKLTPICSDTTLRRTSTQHAGLQLSSYVHSSFLPELYIPPILIYIPQKGISSTLNSLGVRPILLLGVRGWGHRMQLSWLEHQTVMPLMQGQFPSAARDFLPRVNFQCRLSISGCKPPCAIAYINICAHDTDSVVRVKSLVDYGNTNIPNRHGK